MVCVVLQMEILKTNVQKLTIKMAGETRLELAAFCVTGRRSDQLNYSPAKRKMRKAISVVKSNQAPFFVNKKMRNIENKL